MDRDVNKMMENSGLHETYIYIYIYTFRELFGSATGLVGFGEIHLRIGEIW